MQSILPQMIYCLFRKETDPWFNLAAEEYMLRHFQHDVFMIWRNGPSVIIGKHQNAAREINHGFCEANSIPVIRRITGGGTVYHDMGNINFSIVTNGETGKLVDFRKHTAPLIEFLRTKGIDACFEGKNNIRVGKLKISGNAAHVFKQRVIHHGTLLYDSDLEILDRAIEGNEAIYTDRSVRSVRSVVTNLKGLLDDPPATGEFMEEFYRFMTGFLAPSQEYSWQASDLEMINKIKQERYLASEWNRGYSPDYEMDNDFNHEGQNISIWISVKKGVIGEISITSGRKFEPLLMEAEKRLIGAEHSREAVAARLKSINFASGGTPGLIRALVDHLF